jgi:predicted alpha/beta hydrolase family esterase
MQQFLIVPGLGGSGPTHWQSLWERSYPGTTRVEQEDWEEPDRDAWLNQLSRAVRGAPGAILIAHSLGCVVVAQLAEKAPRLPIAGALLVAPADVDAEHCASPQLLELAPMPLSRLPFPAVVVASTNDPYVAIDRGRLFADAWGARFVNAGPCRHINVAAGFGPWPAGEKILDELVRECRKRQNAARGVPTFVCRVPGERHERRN